MRKIRQKLGEKGQAIVEYMLLLVVVISIILGAIYQLNLAFQTWADAYFGEYVLCLLETGELPSIGANNDPNAQCSKPQFRAEFEEGEGSEGDGSGSDGNNNDDNNASDNNNQSSSGSGGPSSRRPRSGDAEGGGNLEGTSSRFKIKRISRGGGEDEEENSVLLSGGTSKDGYYNSNDGRPRRTKISGNFVKGNLGSEKEDETSKKKTTSVKQDPQKKKRADLFKIEQRGPASELDDDIESYTLGDWMRYLIMIAILLMAIFFIGGQALEIFKSMEK